jgi:uncharacterized protein
MTIRRSLVCTVVANQLSAPRTNSQLPANAAGLGLRRSLLQVTEANLASLDFLEIAPENWLDVGGKFGRALARIRQKKPLIAHGLSLSLGGPNPLDSAHIAAIKRFLSDYDIAVYSEHLSACTDDAHLYDLMPIPFTKATLTRLVERIDSVQNQLGQCIAVENSSYYLSLAGDLTELEFIQALLQRTGCMLLLDVNNVHVNSVNHGYDAAAFIAGIPVDKVAYMHVAGHQLESPGLIIDTHGSQVSAPVWTLLGQSYARFGAKPTLLERDFDFPPFTELLAEVAHIRTLMQVHDA